MLWSLPKAGPALLRHLAAYVELASLDLERSRRDVGAEILATAIVAVCALFVVFMACLAVIAYTWDTPYRVAAIVWMGVGFLAAALLALLYRSNVVREIRVPCLGAAGMATGSRAARTHFIGRGLIR